LQDERGRALKEPRVRRPPEHAAFNRANSRGGAGAACSTMPAFSEEQQSRTTRWRATPRAWGGPATSKPTWTLPHCGDVRVGFFFGGKEAALKALKSAGPAW